MKLKIILPYLVVFAVAVSIFLFLLFPKEELVAHINQILNSSGGRVQASIKGIRTVLPFYLNIEEPEFEIADYPKIVPESLNIIPGLGLLSSKNREVKFKSDIYGGSLKGVIGFENLNPIVYTKAAIGLSELKIEKFIYNTRLADIVLSCIINGNYKFLKNSEQDDPANGSLLIEDFSADLKKSLLNQLKLPKIDFSEVKIDFIHDNNIVFVNSLNAKGPMLNVELKGKIMIGETLNRSGVTLTGSILPDSPYLANFVNAPAIKRVLKNIKKEGIHFSITGTLDQPQIKL